MFDVPTMYKVSVYIRVEYVPMCVCEYIFIRNMALYTQQKLFYIPIAFLCIDVYISAYVNINLSVEAKHIIYEYIRLGLDMTDDDACQWTSYIYTYMCGSWARDLEMYIPLTIVHISRPPKKYIR